MTIWQMSAFLVAVDSESQLMDSPDLNMDGASNLNGSCEYLEGGK